MYRLSLRKACLLIAQLNAWVEHRATHVRTWCIGHPGQRWPTVAFGAKQTLISGPSERIYEFAPIRHNAATRVQPGGSSAAGAETRS
jgi:hypothetical protein